MLKDNHEDDGSKDHPYRISTATQLENFRDLVNRGGAGASAHAKLMNNIDLSSVCGESLDAETSWEPIGNSFSNSYSGTFNGNGKTISGLYIDSSGVDYKGLFGRVNGGTVQDLTVSGSVSGHWYVGGVVGYNNGGNVTGCIFSGSGSVSVTGNNYVGGVVGMNNGTVTNCYNTGNVSVTSSDISNVGGVVGYNGSSSTVTNCYNTGNVSVTSSDISNVGGVVGYNISSVTNCYNTGSVSDGTYTGGVVGYNISSVTNCYNTGSVSDGTYTGGVVGYNISSTVTGCYFLKGTAESGIGKNEGSGDAAAKDNTAFHSGEVAYLLQSKQTDGSSQVWGQNLMKEPKDNYPQLRAFDADTPQVYKVAFMNDSEEHDAKYANSGMTVGSPTTNPTKEGYTFAGWFTESSGGSQWNFNDPVNKSMNLYAKWTPVAEPDPDPEPTPDPEPEEPPYTGKYSYEVSTSVGDHGTLSVDRYATEGDKVTIDVTPDQAYKLDDLTVTAGGKDVELTANSDGTYTFTMPSADVRITATFAEDPDWTEPEEPATDVSDIFLDIAPDAWYKDAVQYAYDNGLMTGVSATEFAPEQTTTRAMIVSILARLEGVESAEAAGFADVDDDWYATAVNWAANVGVVNGYEDNTFRPNTAITREQLAAILMNYAAYKGEDVSNRADLTSYTDQPSTWAEEAMQWAVAEGLLTGVTADTLQPQGAATRAQVAAILQRFLSE